jgi:hypothetical protein
MRLRFSPEGALLTPPSRLLEIQLPAILDMPGWALESEPLPAARAAAAKELDSVAVMPAADAAGLSPELLPFVVPIVGEEDLDADLFEAVRMVQVADGPDAVELATRIQAAYPQAIVSLRMALTPSTADRVVELAQAGVKVFHLCADQHGREHLGDSQADTAAQPAGRETEPLGRHVKDVLREVHGRLVKEGLRDEITLISAGGVALPEHMAKAIICGADLVAIDTPLLVALGCRVCRGGDACNSGRDCPAGIGSVDLAYAAQRMVNLMGAWHSQLIEVLGAMGIREVRRLRGEVGRAIFLEDIEKEAFGDLERVSPAEVGA